jgi:small subunit ribosomal protein S27Ae
MGEKKARTRERKKRTGRKHQSLKVWEYYEVEGESVKRKRNPCPRCGPGTMLSEHKNRLYCGRCGYTQIQKGASSGGKEARA